MGNELFCFEGLLGVHFFAALGTTANLLIVLRGTTMDQMLPEHRGLWGRMVEGRETRPKAPLIHSSVIKPSVRRQRRPPGTSHLPRAGRCFANSQVVH